MITFTENEELDAKVEAAKTSFYTQPTPLSCFSPPKWSLLEESLDEQMKKDGTGRPEKTQEALVDSKPESELTEKENLTDEQEVPKNVDAKDVDEPGSAVALDNPLSEGMIESRGESEKITGVPSVDSVKENAAGEPTSNTESYIAVDQISPHVGKDVSAESYDLEKTKPTPPKRSSIKTTSARRFSNDKEDAKAQELINKYLPAARAPTSSHQSVLATDEEVGKGQETWPPVTPTITAENRAVYVMLSQQLQDAKRLMDMPVRRREERLWKVPCKENRYGSIRPDEEHATKKEVEELRAKEEVDDTDMLHTPESNRKIEEGEIRDEGGLKSEENIVPSQSKEGSVADDAGAESEETRG